LLFTLILIGEYLNFAQGSISIKRQRSGLIWFCGITDNLQRIPGTHEFGMQIVQILGFGLLVRIQYWIKSNDMNWSNSHEDIKHLLQ